MTGDRVRFVQFPHPRGEWGPDHGASVRSWTRPQEGHGRKYIRHLGRFSWDGSAVRDGEIGFWGEWEASSKVVRIKRPKHGGPEWIHETLADFSTAAGDRQNTDPFVFGGFFYTGCKQEKRPQFPIGE